MFEMKLFYNGTEICLYLTETTCSRTITLSEGQELAITSPNYPNDYPNSIRCEYEFFASSPDRQIQFTIEQFDTECEHDYLSVIFLSILQFILYPL